ncbi:amino acid ABC transporter ATP-binding protein [Actinotignum urinale]|uniref:amino acid ABC transporter ATP-binding protein n=1 Tax=Actinotignum urinale TaxID=190146 RepID=UPI002A7F8864|nr:amino acid ABC transporter ATP-binding protein [Actinotignum urinale]MDY5129199.1 amino acid ABC transporter ATP-binding protein [Actinotignum urinale]
MQELTVKPVLQLNNIVKSYDGVSNVLDGVSFEVNKGEVIAVIGPSGCGKSTLLRTINGLESIQGGTIEFNGTTITDPGTTWEDVRQKIGMVFQSYELFPHLKVIDNLLLGPKVVAHADKEEALVRARALLERVGLAEKEKALPRELSGGQKQRIAIIRALMMQPEVLLLDEITASLDPEMVREVLDVVLELAAQGLTMVLVTHEMAFARAIADRVIFMDGGRIVETATPEEFFENPSSTRAREFLNTFVF